MTRHKIHRPEILEIAVQNDEKLKTIKPKWLTYYTTHLSDSVLLILPRQQPQDQDTNSKTKTKTSFLGMHGIFGCSS